MALLLRVGVDGVGSLERVAALPGSSSLRARIFPVQIRHRRYKAGVAVSQCRIKYQQNEGLNPLREQTNCPDFIDPKRT